MRIHRFVARAAVVLASSRKSTGWLGAVPSSAFLASCMSTKAAPAPDLDHESEPIDDAGGRHPCRAFDSTLDPQCCRCASTFASQEGPTTADALFPEVQPYLETEFGAGTAWVGGGVVVLSALSTPIFIVGSIMSQDERPLFALGALAACGGVLLFLGLNGQGGKAAARNAARIQAAAAERERRLTLLRAEIQRSVHDDAKEHQVENFK